MSLSAENLEILARSIARGRALVSADPELERSMPSLDTLQRVVDRRTSIEIVQNAFETYADRPAVGFRRHEIVRGAARVLPVFDTLTYRALWDRIASVASGLVHRGVLAAGDIATLVGFSTVDHVVGELACHYLQVTSAPLAKNVAARELELIVNECESRAVFCSIEQVPHVAASLPRCPTVRTLIAMDVIAGDDAHAAAIAGARAANVDVISIRELEGQGPRVPPAIPAEGSDPLLSLVYTSGSTGTPKGAMFHERAWRPRWAGLPFLELAALPMVSVVFLPQNHMGGRNAVANSLKLGGLAYFTHGSDMSTLFDDIRLVRPTYIHLVPRLSEMVYQHFQSEVAHRGSPDAVMAQMRESFLGNRILLALTASAPTPPEVSAFVKRCFDIPIVDVFAGTEYGQLFIDRRLNRRNVLDLKLVSVPELGYLTTDTPYPRGELHVKTARAIARYFKNDQATRDLFDPDGFLRTGDIFEQRGDDEMAWIDRKNNVLKLAQGEFVNIWKLEALFGAGSRFIKQIYIQGASTRAYVLAVIVPEPSEIADASQTKSVLRAELNRIANEHGLEPFEVPRDFIIETEPFSLANGLLTSLNKPARPKLKQTYGAQIERMYDELDRNTLLLADDASLPPAARVRRTIAAILGLTEATLDLAQSFRNYGGDSIAATNLCTLIQRDLGVRLSVGFVLGPRTSLADVCSEIEARLHHDPAAAAMFEKVHGANPDVILERDLRIARFFQPADIAPPADGDARHVLLTGATGFLGRFLCLELLEHARQTGGKVTCLVRAKSDHDAAARLDEVYVPGTPLHVQFSALARDHLDVRAGDLETPRFGWPDERYDALAGDVDTVMHAAALVNHALPYAQLFEANVLGTVEAIRFALHRRAKRFGYTSTNSVSIALLGDRDVALETDDTRRLGDRWPAAGARHASGYQLSKWAGEVLAQDLCESFGVPVDVFRCNLILPAARWRGQLNADDFLTRLVCSVVYTGLGPRSFYDHGAAATPHLDGFPVDFMAAAIAAIVTRASRGHAVYHVNNVHWGDGMSLDSVTRRLVALGYPVTAIDDHAAWFQRFEQALRVLDAGRQAASSLPIIEQWRTPLQPDRRQRIDATRFRARVQALQPSGVADIPHLDHAYFDRFIEDLRALGLIGAPRVTSP